MKTLMMMLAAAVFFAVPAWAGGEACGEAPRVAELYRAAVYSTDRGQSDGDLISGLMPVVTCLSREGYLEQPSGLQGRFALVLEVLAVLRKQSLHVSTADDVDRQVRLFKVKTVTQGRAEAL